VPQRFSAAVKALLQIAAFAAEVADGCSPQRHTGSGTYFIPACAFQKRQLLQSDRMAQLFLDVLLNYRSQEKYLLHEFVLMQSLTG
jgi:hypothetical protein